MNLQDFDILFERLKVGKHQFDFELNDAFFELMENPIIQKGNINVGLVLEKKERMMIADFEFSGFSTVECDRCTDPLDIDVDFEEQIIYKFDEGESEDEHLIYVSQSEFKINVASVCNELVSVNIPLRSVHEDEEECNPDVLDFIDGVATDDEQEDIDPRWEALKKLDKKD